jgi:hypothetical protein
VTGEREIDMASLPGKLLEAVRRAREEYVFTYLTEGGVRIAAIVPVMAVEAAEAVRLAREAGAGT